MSVAHDPLLTLAAAGEPYVQVTTTGRWAEAARLVGSDNALDYLAAFDEPPPAVGIELLWPSAPISFAGTRLDGEEVARLPELVDVLTTAVTDVESVMAALAPQGLGPVVVAQLGAHQRLGRLAIGRHLGWFCMVGSEDRSCWLSAVAGL